MFYAKIKILLFLLVLLSGCGLGSFKTVNSDHFKNINIITPNNKYNLIFKKDLKRIFNTTYISATKYKLNASISFGSTKTSSVGGLNVLKSTKAIINYTFIDLKTNKILEEGSINTFPANSSSSSSLYTNDISIEHVKERLSLSAAKKLYMHLNLIFKK
jgi:hypothetical protein